MSLKDIIHAAVFGCLIGAVGIEQILWDGRSMETPIESTVSAFEVEEEGLSVALTNAIEDARAVVDHLSVEHDKSQRTWIGAQGKGYGEVYCGFLADKVRNTAEAQFRAMRVLGLLEAAREREAGGLA